MLSCHRDMNNFLLSQLNVEEFYERKEEKVQLYEKKVELLLHKKWRMHIQL